MFLQKRMLAFAVLATLLTLSALSQSLAEKSKQKARPIKAIDVLWRKPDNIASQNLFWGSGAKSLAPAPPFRFIEEDKDGESPKFKVRDARGVEWSVKLGVEAQSETVATRLVWAVGYYAEEAYYQDRVRIENLPRLSSSMSKDKELCAARDSSPGGKASSGVRPGIGERILLPEPAN
jgi:hypothetical protein